MFAFPNDPLLPHLAACISREAVETCVRNVAELGSGKSSRVLDFAVVPLKYDPGRGCTCRFLVSVDGSGAGSAWELIAKTHKTDRLARTFETMTRLWADPACHAGQWVTARPYFYDRERRLLWQAALRGRSFWSLYPNLDVTCVFREMARVAASLHASRFAPAGRVLTLLPERRSSPLAQTYSDLGRRHATLLKRLEARRELVAHVDPTSLHGDFHPEQFLIDVEQIGLTDFDSACWGDAAHDLGRFASHVLLKALQRDLAPRLFEEPLEAFFDEYVCRTERPGVRPGIFWHVAEQLLGRRIHKLLKQATESPRDKIEQMLGLAETYLTRAEADS